MDFVAYHDRTSSDHQLQHDKLSNQGYRMISLSVYGDRSNPLYAAVWVKRGGPAWAAIHNATAQEYQAFFNTWTAKGFRPVILSVSGPANNPVFAGTVEQTTAGIPVTRFGLASGAANDSNTIEFWNADAKKKGLVLTCAAIYGDSSAPHYAGIWETNTSNVVWNADGINESASEYQLRFNAQTSGWARPAFVTLNGDRYLSIFRDDQIGSYVARHNMTSQQYQVEFNKWVKEGFYPICVQAGGAGGGARFAALFAKQEQPVARQWIVTGAPSVAKIDQAMKDTMQKFGVRGASLAIVKGTKLVFARGYTWAESGYPAVQPTTLFRIASCSKTITAIAIHQLLAEGKNVLNLTDTAQSILQLKTPSGGNPADPKFSQITVKHLLEQNSGLVPEYTFEDPTVVAQFNTQLPAKVEQTASYMMTKPVISPGTQAATYYSNFGYFTLGLIAAKKRGKAHFIDVVKEKVMAPLQIVRMRLSRSLVSSQAGDEARYHSPDLVLRSSVMTPDQPLVSREYGDENMENMTPSGGLSSAAPDLARVLAALNVKTNNPLLSATEISAMLQAASTTFRGHGWDSGGSFYQKGGLLETSQNCIYYEPGGISFVVCWNTNGVGGDWYPNFPEVVAAAKANAWADTDLFTTAPYNMKPL